MRYAYLFLLAILTGALIVYGPIIQPQSYHQFSAPKLWLILSNIPIMFVGIWGLIRPMHARSSLERTLWICFSIGLILIGIGSMIYHQNPTDQTLFWDRLPIGFTFMVLFSAILVEYIGSGLWISLELVALGILGPLVWLWTGDLRLYVLVQFYPALAIPLIIWFYPATYTLARLIIYAWLWFLLSKLSELVDWQTGLGGHGVKHILVAIAVYCIVRYVQKRRAI